MALSKGQQPQHLAPLDLVNNYVKSSAGLLSCCRPAASVLQKTFDPWHKTYSQDPEYRCTGDGTCPSNGKKPNKKTHCTGCVKWTETIINLLAINPDNIVWKMAEPSKFNVSSIAVAKLFGLKIPPADVQSVKDFSDFDPATVLAIMVRTKLFQGYPDLIKKLEAVCDHRNKVMHRPIVGTLSNEQLVEHQRAYENLIYSLRTHIHKLFNKSDQDEAIKALNKIRDAKLVDPEMVLSAFANLRLEMQLLNLDKPTQDDIKDINNNFQKLLSKINEESQQSASRIADIKKQFCDIQSEFTTMTTAINKNREGVENCTDEIRCVSGDVESLKKKFQMFKNDVVEAKEELDGILKTAVEDFMTKMKKEGLKCSNPKDIGTVITNTRVYNEQQRNISMEFDAQERLECNYEEAGLENRGDIPKDGNCFFHVISDQLSIHGIHQTAAQLRKSVVDYLSSNPIVQGPNGLIDFKDYIEPPHANLDEYLNYMAKEGTWADGLVVFAMAHMLQRHFLVVTSSPQGQGDNTLYWVIADQKYADNEPLLLGHIWENHYLSLQIKECSGLSKSKNPATTAKHEEKAKQPNSSVGDGLLKSKNPATSAKNVEIEKPLTSSVDDGLLKFKNPATSAKHVEIEKPLTSSECSGMLTNPATSAKHVEKQKQPTSLDSCNGSSDYPASWLPKEKCSGGLNLKCIYWTNDTVYLKWNNHPAMIEDDPYVLRYQEGNGDKTNLALSNNYFTKSSLVLPGANYDGSIVLRSGMEYTFYLQAQLEDGHVLQDSVQITMPDGPCEDTLNDLLNDADVLQKVYIHLDCKPLFYRAIARSCGVESSYVDHLKEYKTLDNPITVLVFKACIEKCMEQEDQNALKICNILRELHQIGGRSKILRIIFDWHTGRNGSQRCPVCTRKQFLEN